MMPPIENPSCGLAESQSIPSSQEFELLEGSVREQPVVFHHLVWTGRVLAGTTELEGAQRPMWVQSVSPCLC